MTKRTIIRVLCVMGLAAAGLVACLGMVSGMQNAVGAGFASAPASLLPVPRPPEPLRRPARPADAAVHTVCAAGCDYTTIQAAIDAAAVGDVIKVAAGTYTDVDGEVVNLTKQVTLRGGYSTSDWEVALPDANPTYLDGQNARRVVSIAADIAPTVEGFHIRNGSATNGAGVYIGSGGSATLRRNRIYNNAAASGAGGGVYVAGGSPTLENNLLHGNAARYGGGVYLGGGGPTVRFNTFYNNQATLDGGAIYFLGTPVIRGSIIVTNTAVNGGGIFRAEGSYLPQYNDVWRNTGGNYGGFGTSTPAPNLSADPRLVNPAGGDFRLQAGSPCIDYVPGDYPNDDYAGYTRPYNPVPDAGALEYYPGACFARAGDSYVYGSLQAAVNAAGAGEVVKVAGTCAGVQTVGGTVQVVRIERALTLRGGYTLTNWSRADWTTHRTTLDAGGAGRVVYIADGVAATVEGFDIRNGNHTASVYYQGGGGVFVGDGDSVIRYNRIYNNAVANAQGGGVALRNGDPWVYENEIYSNAATGGDGEGGGVGVQSANGNPRIERNQIHHNTTTNASADGGGGICSTVGSGYTLTVRNNAIYSNTASRGGGLSVGGNGFSVVAENEVYSNTASYTGGGVFVREGGAGSIEENRISGNRVTTAGSGNNEGGGGVYVHGSGAVQISVRGNQIYGNQMTGAGADTFGGGVFVKSFNLATQVTVEANRIYNNQSNYYAGGVAAFTDAGAAYVRNNLVYDNAAAGSGGGVATWEFGTGAVVVENNTIYHNQAGGGGGLYQRGGAPTLRNNIIANSAAGGGMAGDGAPDATCDYCDIFGNTGGNTGGGTGSITTNPQFVDAAGGDFRLQASSPCIHAADPANFAEYDYDNYARPFGARADMGAHEYYSGACFARLSTGGRVYTAVQAAIDLAAAGQTVQVAGYCRESLSIGKELALRGGYTLSNWVEPSTMTTLDANGAGRAILVNGLPATGTFALSGFVIRGGNTTGDGGGVSIASPLSPTIQNVVFYGNAAGGNGGGFASAGGDPRLYNTTFVNNTAVVGGGIYLANGAPVISNTIVAFNSSGVFADAGTTTPRLDYNDVWQNTAYNYGGSAVGAAGAHSFSADPRFEVDGYRLRIDSPCLHAGDPATPQGTDFEGDARVLGRRADVGADERAVYPQPELTPDYQENHAAIPSATLIQMHNLLNAGTVTDTFTLSHAITDTGNGGWSVSHPALFALGPGEAVSAAVTVLVPADGVSGTHALLVLTATSTLNGAVRDTARDALFIEWNPGVEITPAYAERVNPGDVITYVHVVSNTGNSEDAFDLSVSSSHPTWAVVTPTHVALGPRAAAQVFVGVRIPPQIPGGVVERTVLRAVSPSSGVSDEVEDTTEVNYTPGPRYVATTGDNAENNCHVPSLPCRTIAYAVDQATGGDEIKVAEGTYYEYDIVLNKNVTLRGGYDAEWESWPREHPTVIDAQGRGRVLYIFGNPTVEGFTLRGGASDGAGGGVYVSLGRPTIQRNRITGNRAARGGGVASQSGRPNVWNNFIYDNTATEDGGGLYAAGGSSNLWHNTFYGNAAARGGGLYLDGTGHVLSNTIIVANSASVAGGGVYGGSGAPQLAYNDVWNNNGGDYGGSAVAGPGSLSVDPRFVSAATADFHLRVDSPCVSAGGVTSLRDDFDDREQRPMGAGPDIGADEYLVPWVILSPDLGAVVKPNRVVTYVHTVQNIGVRTDIFTFTGDVGPGWVITPSRPVTLEAGVSASVVFSIYVPYRVLSGTVRTAILTATSLYNPAVYDTALDATTVGLSHTVFFTPDQWLLVTSDPSRLIQITYTHRLTNETNYTVTYDINRISGGYVSMASPPAATVAPWAVINPQIIVRIPPLSRSVFVADVQKFGAFSRLLPDISDAVTDTTLVNIRPGVELKPNREGRGRPDEVMIYQHTVTNTGNYTDTFTFTAWDGWWGDLSLEDPPPVTLSPGASAGVKLTVPIPGGALSGTIDIANLVASSHWMPPVQAGVVDTTTVLRNIAVSVEKQEPPTGWCVPAWWKWIVPYWASVTNMGNAIDTFTVTAISSEGLGITLTLLSGSPFGRAPQAATPEGDGRTCLSLDVAQAYREWRGATAPLLVTDTLTVTLDAFESAYFFIEVYNLTGAASAYKDVVSLIATSWADPNVKGMTVFESMINWEAFADLEPNNEYEVRTEQVITYSHVMTYSGTVANNAVTIRAQSGHGWPTTVVPDMVMVSRGDVVSVQVRVEIPLDVISATDIVQVRSETLAECLSWDTAVNTTTVRRPHVDIVPDYTQAVLPDTVITYYHTLQNDGLFTDSYSLAHTLFYSRGIGWSASVVPNQVNNLPPGGTVPVTATVRVPAGVLSDTRAVLTVTATSLTWGPVISGSAVNQMVVALAPRVIITPGQSASTSPGGAVVYTHTLINDTNYTLTLDLTTHNEFCFAEVIAPASGVVTLPPGRSYYPLVVRVEAPEHAAMGDTEETQVIAAWSLTPDLSGQGVGLDYTTIHQISGDRYVAVGGTDLHNNCTNLEYGPCATVQRALDQATPGDVIRVAAGTYRIAPGAGQVISVSKNITLSGGFPTDRWTAPDPAAYPTILDADNLGRVVYVAASVSPTIQGFHIQNGYVEGEGAGVYVAPGASPRLRYNFIHDNDAGGAASKGGGVYYGGGASSLEQNTLYANTAVDGAGFYVAGGAPALWNNVLYNNAASDEGGGLYIADGAVTLWNNTLYHNTAILGGGVYIIRGSVGVSNTIFDSNSTYGLYLAGGEGALDYNDWWNNGTDAYNPSASLAVGAHNLSADPAFLTAGGGPGEGKFYLQRASPCVDAGDPATAVKVDRDGNLRPIFSGYDIGAYENGLSFLKRVTPPAEAASGDVITYTLVISNPGAAGGEYGGADVTVEDALHPLLDCQGGMLSGQGWVTSVGEYADGPCGVTWSGRMAGGTATIVFTARVREWVAPGAVITNAARLNQEWTDVVTTTVAARPGPRYVATTGSNAVGGAANSCLDADHPCGTIQYALGQAQAGDEVRIAEGTYSGAVVSKSVALIGGYGVIPSGWLYDPDIYQTVVSGGSAVVSVTGSAAPMTATLAGLRITGGARGVSGDGAAAGALTLVISRCYIYGNSDDGVQFNGGAGGDALVVERSWLYNNTGDGVSVNNAAYRLDNNILAGNGVGLRAIGASNGALRHNTFAANTSAGADVAGTARFTNTIVANHAAVGVNATGGGVSLAYTLWSNNNPDSTGSPARAHDLSGNPAFVNPAGLDYHIGGGSAALNTGVPAGVDEDVDGQRRPMGFAPDVGADELPVSLQVSKAVTPTLAAAGGRVVYTIRITNTGDLDLHATVRDVLPAAVTHASGSGVLTWTNVLIPAPGGVWTQQVVVTVAWGYSGTLTNRVEATSLEGAVGVYTTTSAARVAPAVAVFKRAAPDPAPAGGRLTYTIYVTNTGNITLTAAITDVLPAQVTPGGAVTWTAVVIPPAAAWTATLPVSVAWSYSGALVNRVDVTTLEGASASYAATSQAQTTPALLVEKRASADPVKAGERLTYTIYVTNTGNTTLHATVEDTLPDCVTTTLPFIWSAVIPAPGGVWSVTLPVETLVGCSARLTNTAQVTTEEGASGGDTAVCDVACLNPLRSVGISGPTSADPGQMVQLNAVLAPSGATGPFTYTWSPAPGMGQGTGAAIYQWPADGVYDVLLTVESCAGTLTATHTITVGVVTCPRPLTDVGEIRGASSGPTGTYTFTVSYTPTNATPPVTIIWSPQPQAGQGTGSVTYTWNAPGVYPISVTVENCGGRFTRTHTVAVGCVPLTGVGVVGPSTGQPNAPYTFSAVITPTDATGPLVYTWQPSPLAGQGTGLVTYTWSAPGEKRITLTVSNCGGSLSGGHAITIGPARLYLPLVLRNSR